MYQDKALQESIKKVEAARAENVKLNPRRMTAEEKDVLLKTFHPDYRDNQFTTLHIGANKGEKVPLELCALLEGQSRLAGRDIDLTKPDYEADVLIIGGGGAGCSAAIEADNAGAKVLLVTKLRMGDANTMMAEGGIRRTSRTIRPRSTSSTPMAAVILPRRRICSTSSSPRRRRPSSGSRTSAWNLTRPPTAR